MSDEEKTMLDVPISFDMPRNGTMHSTSFLFVLSNIYIYIYTSVLLCIYMHKSRWTREVRARMNRSIDVEYKHIADANRKLIVNCF